MELSFSQRALGCLWGEIKRLLKYGNSWGWLECKPGAVFIAQCSRWLFHSLITVWSGEMNGSYLRWNNNPPWNPRWIGTAQDDTQKPLIRAGHSARSAFIWWAYCDMPKYSRYRWEFYSHTAVVYCLFIVFQFNSGVGAHFTRQASLSSSKKTYFNFTMMWNLMRNHS